MKKDLTEKRIDFEKLDFESEQNLVGFFTLLHRIDKRINPDLYKKKLSISNKEKNDRHSNNKYS